MRRTGGLLLLVAVALAPTAQALLVPSYDVSLTIAAPTLNEKGKEPHMGILAAAFNVTGTGTGLFTFSGSHGVNITKVSRVEVFDTTGGAIDLTLSRSAGRPLHAAHNAARLTFDDNATILYHIDDIAVKTNFSFPFAFGIPLVPPKDAISNDQVKLSTGTSLALVGNASGTLTWNRTNGEAFVYLTDAKKSIHVHDATGDHAYKGERFLIRLVHGATLTVPDASAVLTPMGPNMTAQLDHAAKGDLRAGFDLARIGEALGSLTSEKSGNETGMFDANMQQALGSVAPMFNGALVGNPQGTISVGGTNQTLGNLTMVRFGHATMRLAGPANPTHFVIEGEGPFILAADELYTDKEAVGPPVFPMPPLSVFLWLLAVGALIVGYVVKPFLPTNAANSARSIRLVALLGHIVLALFAFVMWDREIRAFMGTSILDQVFGGSPNNIGLGVITLFQVFPYVAAGFFFGLPVRYIANGLFRVLNMKSARGLGKGLGHVASWGLGAAYLPLFLSPIIGILANQLGGGLG